MTKYEIVGNDISDGSHTFGELYDHRNLLWINLCLTRPDDCYWVKDHYDGWDLLLMEIVRNGVRKQMSYHVQSEYRNLYEHSIYEKSLDRHIYDGHSSDDVLRRLAELAKDS